MRRRVALIAALALVVLLGLAVQAQAATFTVGSAADTNVCPSPPAGNNCTLRQLVNSVPAGSTIIVPDTLGTYVLSAGELLIQKNLTIAGAGARTTTIEHNVSGTSARVFDVQPNGSAVPTVTISGLTIESGRTDSTTNTASGGNVLNAGNLTLSEDQIQLGQSTGGGGGGISNQGAGSLTITHSLVQDNSAINQVSGTSGMGGGVENFALRFTGSNLTIDNSTIYNNTAAAGGGGVLSDCAGPCTSTTTIVNSTIFGNDGGTAGTNGGGVLATAGTISLENSILASNTIGTGATASNCGSANISSLGHNIADGTGCPLTATGDRPSTNPQFLKQNPKDPSVFIDDWGGNTDSFVLQATSPAVDAVPAGSPGCTGTDQLDTPRPQGSGCDIGAVEVFGPAEGQQFTRVLASIDPFAISGATIDWGDGTSSAGSVGVDGQTTGTHTYTEAGIYHGAISYVDSDHINQTAQFHIKVVDAPLNSAGSAVNPIAGVSFAGSVATLTDANPFGKVSDFSATVTWGDGTATPGVVSANPGGGFVVTGPHTYAKVGTYSTTIAITDVDGASTTAHGTAIVGARPSPVVTGPPDVKGSTKAAFAGSVNPDGAATTAHFEYGLDRRYVTPGGSGPQYDHSTPSQSVGSDFASHSVSASVSGLVPNALYHVRLVATNAAGTTDGPDMTFRTDRGPAPGTPSLGKTFNVSSTGLVLIEVNGVFIPVTELTKIKNGTIINALHGTLSVTTALPAVQHAVIAAKKKTKKPKTKTQKGKFSGGVFKVTQAALRTGDPGAGRGGEVQGSSDLRQLQDQEGQGRHDRAIQEDVTAAARQRPRQVPHKGPLRRGDRPRHDLDDRRPLRRDADARNQGRRHRQRLRPAQDNHPAARPQLPGACKTTA